MQVHYLFLSSEKADHSSSASFTLHISDSEWRSIHKHASAARLQL